MAETNFNQLRLYIRLPNKEKPDEIDVKKEEFHIGRASISDYVIPESDVSRPHLILKYKNNGTWWAICASKSENTLYNDEPFHPGDERQLFDLDKIFLVLKIGVCEIEFTLPTQVIQQRPIALPRIPRQLNITKNTSDKSGGSGPLGFQCHEDGIFSYKNQRIDLTSTERIIFSILLDRYPNLAPYKILYDRLELKGNPQNTVSTEKNTLQAHISRIRDKLDKVAPNEFVIEADSRNFGYRLIRNK